MLKLTTDKHEASRSLSATAELLVCTCGSNNWESVEDRYGYIHAASGLASTELSFHSCKTFCVIATRASQAKQKMKVGVRKNDNFFQLWFE